MRFLLVLLLIGAVSCVDYTDHYVPVAGNGTLHVVVGGSDCEMKEAILMIHGFPEGWSAWLELCDAIAGDEYCCVMPDMRGYNLSTHFKKVSDYTAHFLLSDMRSLFHWMPTAGLNRGHTKAWLACHDWGGYLSWAFTSTYPQYVKGLLGFDAPHPNVMTHLEHTSEEQRNASSYFLVLDSPPPLAEHFMSQMNFSVLEEETLGHEMWATPERKQNYLDCWRRGVSGGIDWYRANLKLPPPTSKKEAFNINRLKNVTSPTFTGTYYVNVPVILFWGIKDTAILWPSFPEATVAYCKDEIEIIPIDTSHWSEHYPHLTLPHLLPWLAAHKE